MDPTAFVPSLTPYTITCLCRHFRPPGELANAEDHKLGRFERRDANLSDDATESDRFRWIGFLITLHVEGLLGRGAHKRTLQPLEFQERGDVADNALPERSVVWLEHDPVRALED